MPASPQPARHTYLVAGMTCDHCKLAVTPEVAKVDGVTAVEGDLRVDGSDVVVAAVVAAIDEAGYDVVTA